MAKLEREELEDELVKCEFAFKGGLDTVVPEILPALLTDVLVVRSLASCANT